MGEFGGGGRERITFLHEGLALLPPTSPALEQDELHLIIVIASPFPPDLSCVKRWRRWGGRRKEK